MSARRLLRLGTLLLAGALALTACSSAGAATEEATSDGTPVYGGEFVSALYLEPLALDPHRQGFWETYRVSRNLFEGLTKEDTSGETSPTEVLPSLATEWVSSDDAKTWTFTLREGVSFGDGTPFNAEALHKNVQRISDESYEFYDEAGAASLQVWFGNLVSGKILDDYSYEFTFSEPFLGFPRILAQSMATLNIGNPAVWETYGNDGFADHPDGTGPYSFVSRAIGDRIELEKKENYWGTEPYLDKLTFRIIPNNQTRLAALLSGEVDFISYVQPEDVETLESQGFSVPEGTGAQIIYFSFQYANPAIQDERVRKALIHGLDRDRLVEEVYNGYAQPLFSFQPPGNEAYDPELRDFEYDPELAKELLAEAGYDEGELSITLVIDVANQNAGEWLQNEYKKLGIEVKLDSLDRVSYGARTWGGNPLEGDALSIDEYGGTYAEWLFQGTQPIVNQETHPEVYSAIQDALNTSDESQRLDLWKAAEAQFRESALTIPAVNITRYYAVASNVRGFVWPDTNWYDLTTVWLDN